MASVGCQQAFSDGIGGGGIGGGGIGGSPMSLRRGSRLLASSGGLPLGSRSSRACHHMSGRTGEGARATMSPFHRTTLPPGEAHAWTRQRYDAAHGVRST